MRIRTGLTAVVVYSIASTGCGESARSASGPSPLAATTMPSQSFEIEAAQRTDVAIAGDEGSSEVKAEAAATAVAALGSGPFVTSVTPYKVLSRCEAQTLTVRGGGFRPGLRVQVVEPTGRRSVVTGPQVWAVTASSFQMALYTGPGAGLWRLQPTNPDGGVSLPFALLADGVYAPAPPFARSMTPSRIRANGSVQTVTVSGGNFQKGVFATYTAPGGQKLTVGGSLVSVSAVRLSVPFGTKAGIAHLHFTNPDCGQSGLPLSFLLD